MPTWAYIIIAIAVIVLLLALFVWSFLAYKNTPVPKGCERLPSEENCAKCPLANCHDNIYAHKGGKEDK